MKTRCCMSLFNIRERDREDVHLQSQSANTMQGFFPPSSRVTLFRLLLAAASLINWPTCTHDSKQQYLTPSWGNYTKKQKKKPLPLPYTKKQRCECKADDLMMESLFNPLSRENINADETVTLKKSKQSLENRVLQMKEIILGE